MYNNRRSNLNQTNTKIPQTEKAKLLIRSTIYLDKTLKLPTVKLIENPNSCYLFSSVIRLT